MIPDLRAEVVGRERDIEQVIAALRTGRHLVIEGPPGTGKSTLLKAISRQLGTGFEFVEGNAELTPARLVGTFDPSAVLESGYSPDVFLDGPLTAALRGGSLLYIEEINRIPEETLNVLIGVMSEGSLTVPRLGDIEAADGFRLVAAMNPFDAVGTARISGAVYDRVCRLEMGYQDADDERAIVESRIADTGHADSDADAATVGAAVALTRATRSHPDVRIGSSVRGAIDISLLIAELAALRNVPRNAPDVTLDAAQLALSGRIRVHESCQRDPAQIIEELWKVHFGPPVQPDGDSDSDGSGGDPDTDPGKR